jgi:hypothetical protein
VSFLKDLHGEQPDREPPPRVYARVDTIEPGEPERPGHAHEDPEWPFHGRRVLLLDSVDADWFDARGEQIRSLADPKVADEAD